MKIYMLAFLVVAAVAFALPFDEDGHLEPIPFAHHREHRVTCDLFSGLGVGHSACATHCIAKGSKGGSCTSTGICSCRKDK